MISKLICIEEDGTIFTYLLLDNNDISSKILHSFDDEPAIVYRSGVCVWFFHGNVERDNDMPAVINSNGYKAWYKKNARHRDYNKPAIIYENGAKYYYRHGVKIISGN